MNRILKKGGVELIAVVVGITISLWVDDRKELNLVKDTNVKTLLSLKNEVRLRIDYIGRKIKQYDRDIQIGEYVVNNWNHLDYNIVENMTKNDRSIVLTLKAYRAINLPISIYNSLNSDGSIAKLKKDSIKVFLNDLYEVIPAHIVDAVENERVLYHSFNEFIIKNYPKIVDDNISGVNMTIYDKFFNDDIVYGYILEKNHLRKFILRLITRYHERLISFEKLI